MKTNLQLLITIMLVASVSAFASTPREKKYSTVNWDKAEQNYVVALNSDNIGLRHSAASFLAEYRLSGAVKDLINVLQTDKVERVRMAAALALIQIGNSEGRNAVEDAAVYDGSEKVAKFCEQLLNATSQDISLR